MCVCLCVCACIQLCTEERSSKENHCFFLASRAMSVLYYLVVLCSYDLRFTHNALSSKNGNNKARYIYTHTHTHTRIRPHPTCSSAPLEFATSTFPSGFLKSKANWLRSRGEPLPSQNGSPNRIRAFEVCLPRCVDSEKTLGEFFPWTQKVILLPLGP